MKNSISGDKILVIIFYLALLGIAAACLLPFILVLSASMTDEYTILRNGYTLIPGKISFIAYKLIFKSNIIFDAYKVTIFITVVGTTLNLIFTSALSYAISVKSLKYKNAIAFYVYFTMLFNGGLVPMYILISKYLHMKDIIWVMIIPVLINQWNMFLLRNFFKSIPDSLAESAKIDGANDIYILSSIILPVSLPALATIGLFYALAHWNEWFRALLFIENEKLYPLQYIMMRILRNANFAQELSAEAGAQITSLPPAYSSRMASAIVTIGPIIFVYPFIQKYFIKGLIVGAIKG